MALNHTATGSVSYTIVGTPTIVDGILSDCSLSSYLKISSVFAPSNNPWQMVIAFQLDYPNSSSRYCLFNETKGDYRSPKIEVTTTSSTSLKIGTRLTKTNGSWDLVASAKDYTISSYDYNKMSYIRLTFTGTEYKEEFRQEGQDFVTKWVVQSSDAIYQANDSTGISIGSDISSGAQWVTYFPGIIDLNQTYIKINGQAWFGTAPVEVKHIDYGTSVGYTKTGSPTITNGILTGFNANNYLKINSQTFTPGSSPFEIQLDYTVGSSATAYGYSLFLPNININQPGGVGSFRVNITTTTETFYLSTTRAANTHYILKVTYDGNGLYSLYSNGELAASRTSTQLLDISSHAFDYTIGIREDNTGAEINLNNTYVKINGKLWFFRPCVNYVKKEDKLIFADSSIYIESDNLKTYATSDIAPVPAGYPLRDITTPSIGYVDMRTQTFTAAPSGATINKD